jgi:predicted phage terminase large subunit-like protein
LKAEIAGIKPVTPEGSKVARLKAVSPLFENGHIWLPDPLKTPWLQDYILEITGYNGSESETQHTDQVDASSQALSYLERTYGTRSLQSDDGRRKYLLASRGGR